jgi:hypothetical protein
MPQLPSASVSVSAAASTPSAGTDVICILAPCAVQADITPRIFGNANAIHEIHGYSEGVEYASFHMRETRKPVIYVALPIDAPGVISRENSSGNTGTSVVSVTEGADGCLSEHDGILEVERGGLVGTDQIVLRLSLDGGLKFESVRIGTGNAYTIPNVDVDVALAAGTLVAGDTVLTWHGSGPRASMSDVTAAREALASDMKFFRSIILIGDLQSDTEAAAFRDELTAYDTQNQRFVYGRASVYDRLPLATMARERVRMTGAPNVTFTEVGATGDTITRASGSFVADGFAAGMRIDVSGSGSNNFTNALITAVSATVLTLDTQDLAAEGPVGNVTITGTPGLTFAEVGATGDTITRAGGGSFLADGFRAGDRITVSGTVSNNFTNALITAVSATVLTLDTQDLTAEGIGSFSVTLAAGQTEAVWMAAVTDEFESIDGTRYIDLAAGRAWKASPFTGWNFLRPASWAASLREYQHDLHVATWQKKDRATGWNLTDADGNRAQWDDRVGGGAGTSARFTTFTTWPNGPAGAFIARSLTRASDGDILVNTNAVAVLNLALTTVQLATENIIGRSLVLNGDGTAITADRNTMKSEVDAALALALLKDTRGEGQRASLATWTPSADDVLNVADPAITGVLDLNLNGNVVSVNTTVRVRSGDQ